MKCGLVFRRIAELEFDEAVGWYEGEREGLGQEFRAAIEEHLQRIADNPEMFPEVRREVRRVVVRRFPFVIHFRIEQKRIVILSVFHTSRDSKQVESRH